MRPLTLRPLAAALAMSLGGVSVGFAAQTCPVGFTLNAPNSRYVVQTDTSQVKDINTTLIWQRCSVGQTGSTCAGSPTILSWQSALTAAATAGSSGGFAWRVPNNKELLSLVETACYNPAINTSMFPGTASAGYWSSSSFAGDPSYAWNVYFILGLDFNDFKANSYYVRLVRSSQ